MFEVVPNTPVRAYQVRIRDEYLDKLYLFDAGMIEQEIFAKAERGLIIVKTDRPETIFQKLGEAIQSVTYLGPMVDLPEQPLYANHSVVSRTSVAREAESEDFAEGLWPDSRPIHTRILAFMGHLIVMPFLHILRPVAKKILPDRAVRALHIGEES